MVYPRPGAGPLGLLGLWLSLPASFLIATFFWFLGWVEMLLQGDHAASLGEKDVLWRKGSM